MVKCPHCGTENRADARFCNSCGFALGATGAAGHAPTAPTSAVSPTVAAGPRPANATGRLAPNSTLRGRYLILQKVGQGGMAAVYQAHDLRSGVSVAVKEMSQEGLPPDELTEALDSFQSEARMLTRLRHPNLPRVYETFEEQGRQYLVMDYIAGKTLEQVQKARGGGALPEAEVLGWARQLCDVLAYLHAQRPPIIFRDLKPANVMLTDAGQIKLIDFGIARVFAPGRTRDTQVLGTPGFAPPEQYGKAQTDARADVYALACTLYQLLSGYDPGTTPFNLPPLASRNPAVAPAVQRAIEHATRLDRDLRPATVEDFRRELLAAAPPRPAPRPQPQQQPQPRPAASATGAYRAARATPGTTATRVVVQPYTVDFGTLVAGQRGTVAITVSGLGGQPARGTIASLVPWLRLDRDRFDGKSTVIQVIAETSQLAGATGVQTTSLQVNCDSHALFVPVRVEVKPAPRVSRATRPVPAVAPTSAKSKSKTGTGAPASTVPKQPGAQKQPRPVPAKYTQPPVRRPWIVRIITSVLSGLVLAVGAGQAAEQAFAHSLLPFPMTAPAALGVLTLVTLLAALGALAGGGRPGWPGRLRTTLAAGALAFAAALVLSGPWYWHGVGEFLTRPVAIPRVALIATQLAASAGGALGADAAGSRALLALARFVRRYANIFAFVGLGLGGAIAGFVLTQGLFYGCLTPFAVIGGAWLGVNLARLLGFTIRPPRYRVRRPQRPRYMGRTYP